MTREEFINKVIDEITEGMSIPSSPNISRINTIIDNTLRKFYDRDDNTNYQEFIFLKNELFHTELYKSKRQVKMPDCVIAISDLRIPGNHFSIQNYNQDPNTQNNNIVYLSAVSGNPNQMLTGVVNSFYQNFLRNFYVSNISFGYNSYSKMLTIEGRDPTSDMVAIGHLKLQEEYMFEMDRFFEYVSSKCKLSFSNIIGFVNMKLLGGYEVQISEMKSDAKDKIKEIEEFWKEESGRVDFLLDF